MRSVGQIANFFIESNFPDTPSGVGADFASDIIDREPTWTLQDVVLFFKFVRQRQDIEALQVQKNKLSSMQMMKWVPIYEEHKAEEREKLLEEKKSQIYDEHFTRESEDRSIKGLMGKQLEKLQAEREKNPVKQIKRPPADEVYFNQFK